MLNYLIVFFIGWITGVAAHKWRLRRLYAQKLDAAERRLALSAPITLGYRVRESHMDGDVRIIDKLDLTHVSIVEKDQ